MPRRALLLVVLLCSSLTALAQEVEFGVSGPGPNASDWNLSLMFREMPSGEGSSDLLIAAGDSLGLAFQYQQGAALATVGNLVFTIGGSASSDGLYRAAFTTRGVLGPVAFRARTSVSDGLDPLLPVTVGEMPRLPRLGAGPPIFGLELGASYRASRLLIVHATPGLFLRGGALGLRLDGELELVRAVDSDDLSLLVHALATPGLKSGSAAVGVGYTLNRRRAPGWKASAWLGLGPAGLLPGATVSGGERVPNGSVEMALSAEPYRLDVWPYRLSLDLRQQVEPGELRLGVLAGLIPERGWGAEARAAYSLPLHP